MNINSKINEFQNRIFYLYLTIFPTFTYLNKIDLNDIGSLFNDGMCRFSKHFKLKTLMAPNLGILKIKRIRFDHRLGTYIQFTHSV